MARKILLADDSVTAQNMGRKILADAGYDVVTVNNGSAALKRIAESKPDLIILDVYMPGYSGLEVCQRLKDSSETAHIPVLLSVGKLEPFKPQEARRVRADAHIVKPFEASELLAALGHLETCIVPPAHRPGFCAPISSPADGDKEESCKEKDEDKNNEETANTGNDNGRKASVRTASAKKKKEEPVAAVDDGVANFRDFRKAGAKPATDSVPEMPRDITKEELDALSAVAARLDESIPAPQNSPSPKEEVSALSEMPSSRSTSANLEPAQNHEPLSEMTRGITKEELDALSAVAARLSDSNLGTSPIASAVEEEATPAETSNLTAPMAGNLEQPQMPVVAPSSDMTEEKVDTLATAWNEAESPNGQAETAPEMSTADERVSQVESRAESQRDVPVSDPVNAGQFVDEPAPIDRDDEPIFASAVADTPPPSDEEVAAALSLLTPANGHAGLASGTGSAAASADGGPHWTAETVGLTPEEAALSLEAEMFRTFAGDPAAADLVEADPVEEVESTPIVDGALSSTPAVESAPAIAAPTIAAPVELASDEAPKAMAAAAAAAESIGAGSDESDIANIVDRVLADLRPKIVEEIAKKLGKK